MRRAELLLLDEPVAGMVHDESMAMAEAIADARAELGISVLLVEHDMAFVMGIADRITVLDFGRRIAERHARRRSSTTPRCCAPTWEARREPVRHALSSAACSSARSTRSSRSGSSIVFKATRVINFAQGSVLLLGAYVIGRTHERLGFGSRCCAGIAVAAHRRGADRPAHPAARARPTSARCAILTLGVDILLLTELTRRIGTDVLSIGAPWGSNVVEVAGSGSPTSRVIAGAACARCSSPRFAAVFKFTDWGIAMRSAAEDGETAR